MVCFSGARQISSRRRNSVKSKLVTKQSSPQVTLSNHHHTYARTHTHTQTLACARAYTYIQINIHVHTFKCKPKVLTGPFQIYTSLQNCAQPHGCHNTANVKPRHISSRTLECSFRHSNDLDPGYDIELRRRFLYYHCQQF